MQHDKIHLPLTLAFSACLATINAYAQEQETPARPNVILLVADDLGYGDLGCYGAKNVETPNVDALAQSGIRFTNCHAVAATSTPSRYSLLTGEYAWRKRAETSVAAGNAASIIRADQYTMADMFHDAGYTTAAIGKWHLGLGTVTGQQDWNGKLDLTPADIGFDYHYIMAATADRVPCVYIEQGSVANHDPSAPIQVSYNSNFAGEPTGQNNPELLKLHPSHGHNQSIVDSISRIGYMKGGGKALWQDENIADSIAAHAIEFIQQSKDEPFFMYLCTNDIHVPRWPHERFRGKNIMGLRGDAIMQFDWTVGQITDALKALGIYENTLILVTSDNGPIHDDGYADQAVELLNGHSPTGGRRGMKYSGYEGGTLVPCIVSWPEGVSPDNDNNTLLSHIDFMASFGSLIGTDLPKASAPDSGDYMDQLLGRSLEHRPWVSELPSAGPITVCTSQWKYIPASNTNQYITFGPPNVETGAKPHDQLFDLINDPNETTNVAEENPEVLEMMKKIYVEAQSTPFDLPNFSTAESEYWYTISTPNRNNLHMTLTADGLLMGVDASESIFARSQWKFTLREDGSCNIINRNTGTYIDPTSAENRGELSMSTNEPTKGWVIDYANTAGCVVFYTADLTSQMNQGPADRNFRILNWGGGTNHSDAGCQFRFNEVYGEPTSEIALPTTAGTPVASTAESPRWYTICANKRNRHYLATGDGETAVSTTATYYSPTLAWRLEANENGTFNIINKNNDLYLNPTTTDSNELTVTSAAPEAGWDITAASSSYYVISCGTDTQVSISTEADGYKVVNFDSPVSTTNAGCQFRFVDITDLISTSSIIQVHTEDNESEILYDLHGRRVMNPMRHGIYITSTGRRIIK